MMGIHPAEDLAKIRGSHSERTGSEFTQVRLEPSRGINRRVGSRQTQRRGPNPQRPMAALFDNLIAKGIGLAPVGFSLHGPV